MKIIKEEYSLGTQSANFTKIIEGDNGLKIKIDIKSDSYDFQSYAKLSVFNSHELSWNIVDSIPFSNMKTPSKLYYKIQPPSKNANILASYFVSDTDTLISTAEAVLGDNFSVKPASKKTVTKKIKP